MAGPELYVGLISGTSMDGIDAALVDFSTTPGSLIDAKTFPLPSTLRETLLNLCATSPDEIHRMGQADRELGQHFAAAANRLLTNNGVTTKDVIAIGSHGQTIRHYPLGDHPYTLQIADPNTIAELTGITTIADFRRRDIAAGGEGAPLVPAFHEAAFTRPEAERFIVNIGGIGNITHLRCNQPTTGYDTGPGNVLLDSWIYHKQQKCVDENAEWAKQGKVEPVLLEHLLKDTYFTQSAPKSTGREYFNLTWLLKNLQPYPNLKPEDVQATLVELTARSIANDIKKSAINADYDVYVCGGGSHNPLIMERLQHYLAPAKVGTTSVLGIDPDWVEAVAFAWLAQRCLTKLPGNNPHVTGASHPVILGGIYTA